jgi:hypothetical protein
MVGRHSADCTEDHFNPLLLNKMPCQRGMRGCHRNCAHRQLVADYHMARQAWEDLLEQETGLYPTEVEFFKQNNPGPTFKEWLKQNGES